MVFLGDIHGDLNAFNKFIYESDEKYCIQLGDFGGIWSDKAETIKEEKILLSSLNDNLSIYDKYVFIVLGNHENYDRIGELPKEKKFGAWCKKIDSQIFIVERGEILNIDNKTYLCVGGADSIDKDYRLTYEKVTDEKIWWEDETIQDSDIDNAYKNLKEYKNKVDFICTHTPPRAFISRNDKWAYVFPSEVKLNKFMEDADFRFWISGHVHEDRYENIAGNSIMSLGIMSYFMVD